MINEQKLFSKINHMMQSCGSEGSRNYKFKNPVEEGLVFKGEDYKYSSAVDYSGENGMIDNIIVVKEL